MSALRARGCRHRGTKKTRKTELTDVCASRQRLTTQGNDNGKGRMWKGKQEKQGWDEASNDSASLKSPKTLKISNIRMEKNQGERSTSHADAPPRWGSSLVCADLSLNDVGSKLYWPLLSSLKTKFEIHKDMEEISVENNFKVGAMLCGSS